MSDQAPQVVGIPMNLQTSDVEGSDGSWHVQLSVQIGTVVVYITLPTPAARLLGKNLINRAIECETKLVKPKGPLPPSPLQS